MYFDKMQEQLAKSEDKLRESTQKIYTMNYSDSEIGDSQEKIEGAEKINKL